MTFSARQKRDVVRLRSDLAGVAVSLGWLRVERSLLHKYRPDQPRVPAGNIGAGRWTLGGPAASGDDGTGGSTRSEETVLADGSRVLTLRIRANRSADPVEHYAVTTPDGERTLFENSGWTQTIRDGDTGDILSRSTLTRDGAEPEAFIQSAKGPLAARIQSAISAAGTVFVAISQQNNRAFTAVFAAPASEYKPGEGPEAVPIWVGKVSQPDLDAACPRNGEVQALADETAARVRATGAYLSPQDFGNKVHLLIADEVNSRNDENFVAEKSYGTSGQADIRYGTAGSIRVDVLERAASNTVCVYDHKTGISGLGPARAVQIMSMVQRNFPGTQRFLMIEIRPRR